MRWTYKAVSGTRPLLFTDDVTANRSIRMNSEVFESLLRSNKEAETEGSCSKGLTEHRKERNSIW